MEVAKLQTLEQIKAFLDGTSEVAFWVPKEDRNPFIWRVLKRFGYAPHGRVDNGVLLRYIERMTGLSRQQVTRLVGQYRKDGRLSKQPRKPKQGFAYCYTAADMLAVCVASTVDVVSSREHDAPGKVLAQAVGLDMGAWWKPTAEGYFSHVSKAVILEAVQQFAPQYVTRLAKLKKADIASEAERLAEGTGWMPAMFKSEDSTGAAQDDTHEEATQDAAAEVEEVAEALAA